MDREQSAVLLIKQGRRWLTLTDEDIQRGARAVISDPHYRTEIWRDARLHSEECCSCPSVASLDAAYKLLGGRNG
jgi:hypothetical protein